MSRRVDERAAVGRGRRRWGFGSGVAKRGRREGGGTAVVRGPGRPGRRRQRRGSTTFGVRPRVCRDIPDAGWRLEDEYLNPKCETRSKWHRSKIRGGQRPEAEASDVKGKAFGRPGPASAAGAYHFWRMPKVCRDIPGMEDGASVEGRMG